MRPMIKEALAALTPRRKLRCSFCRRSADAVGRLVGGPSVHICDACVEACVHILQDHGGFELRRRDRPH
jgi:hypothetical protein